MRPVFLASNLAEALRNRITGEGIDAYTTEGEPGSSEDANCTARLAAVGSGS